MANINNTINSFYEAPVINKIMTIMLVKNVGYGFYIGIKNFKSSERPVTQLFDSVFSYTIWGFVEATFWPLTFTHLITSELDRFAKFLMDKK